VAETEFDQLDAPSAARLVEECAEAERVLAAIRVLATATLENKAWWRREGFRSAAAWMASKTGGPVGPAIATLEMAGLLKDLPLLAAAFADGLLSEAQAREIAEVAAEVPEAQEQLIEAAGKLSLKGLREECQRMEAAAIDDDERHRRVHKRRRTRSWVRKGEGTLTAKMTPDELARLMARLDVRTDELVAEAILGGWFESREAHSVDALIDLVRGDATSAGPETMVHVVVDYEALVRGHTVEGETCEISGVGPIPVSVARFMSQDAILKVLVTKGVDVVTVAHAGYTIPAHLRSALDVRDRKCIVPGCDAHRRLERDHRNTFSRTRHQTRGSGPPVPLAPLPEDLPGLHLPGQTGGLGVVPPENRDIDLSALRRVVTCARRC
jgi:hypothetical protein